MFLFMAQRFTTKWNLEVFQLLISIYRFTNSDSVLSICRFLTDLFFFGAQCGFWISVLDSTYGVPVFLHFGFFMFQSITHVNLAPPRPVPLQGRN